MGYDNINSAISLVERQHDALASEVDKAIRNLEHNAEDGEYDKEIETTTVPVVKNDHLVASVGDLHDPSGFHDIGQADKIYSHNPDDINPDIEFNVPDAEEHSIRFGTTSDGGINGTAVLATSDLYSTVVPADIEAGGIIVDPIEITGAVGDTATDVDPSISAFSNVTVKNTSDTGWVPEWYKELDGKVPEVSFTDVSTILSRPSIDSYQYTSALLDSIEDAVADICLGAYGSMLSLNLWLRDEATSLQVLADNSDEVKRQFAGRGFPNPTSFGQSAVVSLLNKYQLDNANKTFATTEELSSISREFEASSMRSGLAVEDLKSKAIVAYKSLYVSTVEMITSKYESGLRNDVRSLGLDIQQIKSEIAVSETNAQLEADIDSANSGIVVSNIRNNIKVYQSMLARDIAQGDVAVGVERANLSTTKANAGADIAIQRAMTDVFGLQVRQDIAKGNVEIKTEAINAKIVSAKTDSELLRLNAAIDMYKANVKQDLSLGETDLSTARANLSYVEAKVKEEKARLTGNTLAYKAKVDERVQNAETAIAIEHANVSHIRAQASSTISELNGMLTKYEQDVKQDISKADIEMQAEEINLKYRQLEFEINLANTSAAISLAETNLRAWTNTYKDRLAASAASVDSMNSLMYGWGNMVSKIDITEESISAE